MRKGASTLSAALLAVAFVVATPAVDAGVADDITVVGEAILAAPIATVTTSAAAVDCTDTAYALSSWRLSGSYDWYYNPAGAVPSVSSVALATISRATTTVMTGQNRCGVKPTLVISQSYKGASTKVPQVSSTGTCTGNDGVSVTGWGTLPTNTLAYTCAYYRTSTGVLTSSDMLLNNGRKWFVGTPPVGCVDSFDLESVVVHERGHTAGLAHVDQTAHELQTMSPRTMACTIYKRLLGGGDVKGLQALSATR